LDFRIVLADTHVWGLTLAHLRWSVLQRCGKEFSLKIEDDDAYWKAVETIPIGFLFGGGWQNILERMKAQGSIDEEWRAQTIQQVKAVMMLLEPTRWATEKIPTDEEIGEVVEYVFFQHLIPLLEIQNEMFSDVNPQNEDTIVKAFLGTQKQNQLMESLGAFSRNDAMKNSFAQRRNMVEEKTGGAFK